MGQAGPAAVDFAALHICSQNKHRIGVAVIGAAGAVFTGGAAELRHGDQRDVGGIVSQVAPEGRNGSREVGEAIGELAVDAALVMMRVPAVDVSESSLDSEIGFEQLRDLLHAVAEFGGWIIGASGGLVLRGIGGAEHLHRVECFFARGVEDAIAAGAVHGFECRGRGSRSRTTSTDGEVIHIVECDRRNSAGKRARNIGAESEGAKRGVFLAPAQVFRLQCAIQPAVIGVLNAGCAGLHVVLGVEVRARHVGRAGSVDDGEMSLVVERFEGSHRGMQPEESIEIDDLVGRDRNAGTHGVVILLAIRHDDVEPVRRAPLKNDDQPAVRSRGAFCQHGADEKAGNRGGSGQRQCAFVEEEAAIGLHDGSFSAALKFR